MPMIDGDWSVDRGTGNIRYIGFDHSPTTTVTAGSFVTGDYYQIRSVGSTDFTLVGAASNTVGVRFEATGAGSGTGVATQAASYSTVIQFHRWLQALADDPEFSGDDELDIIDRDPSARSTDNIITLSDHTAAGGVKYNVTATEIEHLYDGSITQGSGPTQERWDGIVNFGNANAHIQLTQDGAILSDDYWNYGWQAGTMTPVTTSTTVLTDSTASWTTDEWVGYTIINVTDASRGLVTSNTATTITVAELYGGTDNDWDQSDVYNIAVPINGDSAAGISHRFMTKVREDGVDTNRRRLLGTSRRYGNTYSEFSINGSNPGNNVLALSDTGDLNNTTSAATIDAITDITNTEGLRLIDISGDGTDEEYYSEWDRGANTINTFYEYLKWRSADSNPSGSNLQGESGELHRGPTHSFAYDAETGAPTTATNDKHVFGTFVSHGAVTGGPFQVGEAVHEDTATPVWKGRVLGVDTVATSLVIDLESGTIGNTEAFTGQTSGAQATTDAVPGAQTSAGEVKVLAFDDDGSSGNFYVQLTKGVAPVDDEVIYDATDHTDSYTQNGGSTERAVSTPFAGASTGSALIGAYGLGLEAADTAAADTYFDLQNNPITPPNNVTFTASGFANGDYVLVTENDGADYINFTQMSLNATYSATNVTSISVNAIPSDTPTSAGTKGSLRIERDDGLYSLHRYTSFDTGTDDFVIPTTDFSGNNATSGNNAFIGYLDYTASGTSDTFSYVYDTDRDHFGQVRDGGATPIKTANATGTMTSTGGTMAFNRIDDT